MSSPRPSKPGRSAFSLVELLVVIAIIAVLVSLLLPSLRRAREQAIRVQCLSNIRQVGLAISSYANDFGEYPVVYTSEGGGLTATLVTPHPFFFLPSNVSTMWPNCDFSCYTAQAEEIMWLRMLGYLGYIKNGQDYFYSASANKNYYLTPPLACPVTMDTKGSIWDQPHWGGASHYPTPSGRLAHYQYLGPGTGWYIDELGSGLWYSNISRKRAPWNGWVGGFVGNTRRYRARAIACCAGFSFPFLVNERLEPHDTRVRHPNRVQINSTSTALRFYRSYLFTDGSAIFNNGAPDQRLVDSQSP